MSKLTREVRYLNESDRPKKVEPLGFREWCESAGKVSPYKMSEAAIDNCAKQYATYLQEFSAEEKAVEFKDHLWYGSIMESSGTPNDWESVTYLGKIQEVDCFLCYSKENSRPALWDKSSNIFFGHLHSGKF